MAFAINYKDIRELAVSGYSEPLKPGLVLPFGLEQKFFSETFRFAINTDRQSRVFLAVWTRGQAVENIVGADVQTTNTVAGAEQTEFGGSARIDLFSLGFVLLAPVNVGGRSGIDQQIEPETAQLFPNRLGQIQLLATERKNVIGIGKKPAQGCAKPPVFTHKGNPPFHRKR